MKKYLALLLGFVFLAGLSACGDNKTKEKLYGTTLVNSQSGNSFTSNPAAASMTALYRVAYAGAGAGSFSMSGAPRRAPSRAPGGSDGIGLGTPNSSGEYVTVDPILGMTMTIAFKKSGNTVYMDFAKVFSGGALYLYTAQDFTTSTRLSTNDTAGIMGFFTGNPTGSLYIPTVWVYTSGSPIRWFAADSGELTGGLTSLEAWMTAAASFPDSMMNTVTGAIPGGIMNMSMTATGISGPPSDANPMNLTGSGTINLNSGEMWTVTAAVTIGESGPIGGTQTFSSTTGMTGSMTFSATGMTGTIMNGSEQVATITIDSSGNGSYTDLATGQTYAISGVKPS